VNFIRTGKIIVTITWLVLLGLLIGRDFFVRKIDSREIRALQKADQERYYGVWFKNRRIGYVAETLQPEEENIILNQQAHILLNVLETTQPIDMKVNARLNRQFILHDFDFHFTSPFYTMSAQGHVEGNDVLFTLDTGQSTINDKVSLSAPPLLAVNDRSYLLERLNNPGEKIKIPSFDPLSLTGRESVVTYHGQEKILVQRRVKQLHHFSELFSGMRINFWLDDNGRIVQEESPAGFKFIAEPEFRAKDVVRSGNELLSSVAVPLKGPLPDPESRQITYRLTLPSGFDHDLEGGRQQFDDNILTVSFEKIPSQSEKVVMNFCGQAEYLQPSRYVQSDHQDIKTLAGEIVGMETDPVVHVRLLADWVFRNLEKRPVLGLPDALTTLHSKKGDCNEHASLFAALARSLGIPAVIATGVTKMNNAFYYHAWNEVCLNGNWYSLDTTTNQMPADLFHIRFSRGDMDQQLKIGALLGNLKIDIIPQDK
jgi:hypothetical protein